MRKVSVFYPGVNGWHKTKNMRRHEETKKGRRRINESGGPGNDEVYGCLLESFSEYQRLKGITDIVW